MRALFIGAPVAPHPAYSRMSAQQKLAYLGANTGNLLIGQSLREQLTLDSYGTGQPDPDYANENFDIIAIPAANFLFHKFDFGFLADYLERVQLPVVMVGLGAQATKAGAFEGIPDGTHRMLSIVAERSLEIGVRGEFTASVMNDLGFKNILPIGCPSAYRSQTSSLTIRPLPDRPRVSLNGSRDVISHASDAKAFSRFESAVIQYAMANNFPYVLQSEKLDISYVADRESPENSINSTNRHINISDLNINTDDYVRYLEKWGRVFFSVNDWDKHIRSYDLSFGSRFHGNLIALTNGVAAFIVTHDSRTTELCQLLNIPHAPVETVEQIDPVELAASSDFTAFSNRYRDMYISYANFLNRNGLSTTLG